MKKAKQPVAVDAEIARQRDLIAKFSDPQLQAELEAVETDDALTLLRQLNVLELDEIPARISVVKRWLRCHWSRGWAAAGGPGGAPGPEAYAKQPGEVKK